MFLSCSKHAYKLTVTNQFHKIITCKASGRAWVGWDKGEKIIERKEGEKGEELKLLHGTWDNIKDQSFVVVNKPAGVAIKDQDPSVDSLERRMAKTIQFYNREVI